MATYTAEPTALPQAMTKPLVEAATGCCDATAAPSKRIAPRPPPAGGQGVEVSAVAEASVSAASQACGVAVEAPAADAMAADPLKIIDLHALDLPGNDMDIYKAMLERMLGESEELGGRGS